MKKHTLNVAESAKFEGKNRQFSSLPSRFIGLFLLGMAFTLFACTAAPATPTSVPTLLPTPTLIDESGCPGPSGVIQLLTNEEHGYCLLVQDGYARVDPLPEEVCLVAGGASIACHSADLIIQVENAAGRTPSQVADEMIVEAQVAAPGIEVQRTDLTVSGEQAVMLEGIPGVDVSRIILIVHADRLYKLTFVPWDETREEFTRVENLYDLVINSFTFLR